MKAWTITQLKRSMDQDLKKCTTYGEFDMCRTICVKEMRELADSLTRKLTPCETAILESL